MLTPYLLTKFQNFSVYLISETWKTIWKFLKGLKGKFIKTRVTTGVHWPGRPRRTKPLPSGPKGWPVGPTLVDRPHFGTKHPETWLLHWLGGGKEWTDFTKSFWPKVMAARPCGGHPSVDLQGTASAKSIREPTLGPYKYPPSCHFGRHTLQ
jgi:hypothetical protein